MKRLQPAIHLALLALLSVATGCQPQQPFFVGEDGDLSHYLDVATELESPDLYEETLPDAEQASKPFTLGSTEPQPPWDLSLEEAVEIALRNSKVMRTVGGQVSSPPTTLTRSPSGAASIYDPAITESDPRYGVDAALSAFDAQFSTSMIWEKTDTPQNVSTDGEAVTPRILQEDTGTFQTRLEKTYATGATFGITHNVAYEQSNSPLRAFVSDYSVNLEADFRQPLLRGSGVQFNRIAGPNGIAGYYNGVMIARVNTDISLADFEISVRDLVFEVEQTYWELYYAYRSLDSVLTGRDSALETWRKVHAMFSTGSDEGSLSKETQAREQYFLFRSTVEQALNRLYSAEANLRYLMGLAVNDGRLIRPVTEPTTADIVFDWYELNMESLARSPELRRQRWVVKRREMEIIAAKNYLMPQLDAVGKYRWLGMGDHLFDENSADNEFLGAYDSMTGGDFQEWEVGLELSMTLGFRQGMAAVRNAQLLLARERMRLQEEELEVSHQVGFSYRQLEANKVLAQSNYSRRVAAAQELDAVTNDYENPNLQQRARVSLYEVLDAQRRLAQAESDYYRSVVDYNIAVAQVHLRKGSLLEYNGISLKEGPWPNKAYYDACLRARERDAGIYMNYGFTQPKVISAGPVTQNAGTPDALFETASPDTVMVPSEAEPTEAASGSKDAEMLPTPAPEPPTPEGEHDLLQSPAAQDPQTSVLRIRSDNVATTSATAAEPRKLDLTLFSTGSTVRTVNYQEASRNASAGAPAPAPATRGWTSTRPLRPSESAASSSASQAASSGTGWKSVQR